MLKPPPASATQKDYLSGWQAYLVNVERYCRSYIDNIGCTGTHTIHVPLANRLNAGTAALLFGAMWTLRRETILLGELAKAGYDGAELDLRSISSRQLAADTSQILEAIDAIPTTYRIDVMHFLGFSHSVRACVALLDGLRLTKRSAVLATETCGVDYFVFLFSALANQWLDFSALRLGAVQDEYRRYLLIRDDVDGAPLYVRVGLLQAAMAMACRRIGTGFVREGHSALGDQMCSGLMSEWPCRAIIMSWKAVPCTWQSLARPADSVAGLWDRRSEVGLGALPNCSTESKRIGSSLGSAKAYER